MARPGKSIAKQSEGRAGGKYLPVGGRVKKLRAIRINQAAIEREIGNWEGVRNGRSTASIPVRERASLEGDSKAAEIGRASCRERVCYAV